MTYEADVIYVGKIQTTAPSEWKAIQNIRYRLYKEHGWKWFMAMHADVQVRRIE